MRTVGDKANCQGQGELFSKHFFDTLFRVSNGTFAEHCPIPHAFEPMYVFTQTTCTLGATSTVIALTHFKKENQAMLWTILVILAILWLLGFIGNIGGNLIHILLVVALVVLIINLVSGRRTL
jgi:hypothetical membrane protein